ncbi:glycerol ABC transporter substrate-binding protein [Halorussus amylolyticus]|uniref:glycerol ABC transporter substrate-binding protein n=1 Tax=Halorussus amylolyticus TaxID=1126242 RepID=UPI00104816C3|nr:glycerol ABC transporter substrate-binding protein [Halorussus amylolyticus]
MAESESPRTALHVALGVLAVVVVLYSVLIAGRPLLGVSVVLGIFGAYLAWRLFGLAVRFVAAFERIADAMEAREGDSRSRDRGL